MSDSDHEQLFDHLAAARAIVDLVCLCANDEEDGRDTQLNPATMRRALQETLRHLEAAEGLTADMQELRS